MPIHRFIPGLAACAVALTSLAAQASPWTHDPEDDALGRIYYYERTNTDGSRDERVTIFRRDATRLEVYKENGLCRNAALVTAELDLETLSARKITGGALQPGGQHVEFAFMEQVPGTDRIEMVVELPDGEIRNDMTLEEPHWILFDFDLASLTVAAPHLDDRRDGFGFGMGLLWADPSAPDPLYWMGEVDAEWAGATTRLGRDADEFRLTGSAFEGPRSTGEPARLWLDAEHGHIVDAVMPIPNHPGYRDFRLRLLEFSDGGEPEWTALLKRHFEDCD